MDPQALSAAPCIVAHPPSISVVVDKAIIFNVSFIINGSPVKDGLHRSISYVSGPPSLIGEGIGILNTSVSRHSL